MGTIPVIKSIVDYRNLVTLGFYVLFGKVVYFALCKQGRLNRALIMVILVLIMFVKFKKNSYKEALILVITLNKFCKCKILSIKISINWDSITFKVDIFSQCLHFCQAHRQMMLQTNAKS